MPATGDHHTPSSVLSTLNPDGSRRWLRPRPSRGTFWRRRRVIAYALIAVFTLVPYVKINGRPLVLLDIPARQFSILGEVFFPTDTLLLALAVVSVFVGIFLVTAIAGRLWCGWACPQTVYMEFLIRPIERLFDGEPGKKSRSGAWRTPAKYATYLLVCAFLAHTFLAYFVGIDTLRTWVTGSPADHPVGFFVMAFTTGLMMFDFCFFREQTCLVACPYGRMQSVLLDRSSLIVSYDPSRGEPRGKLRRSRNPGADVALKVVADEPRGDCIDCHKCVTTCPTGIDIRNGLQMECVHCTQCIDACDEVMERIGKPRGLIRYSSQAAIEGDTRRLFRPRVVVYPAILLTLLVGLVVALASIRPAEFNVTRNRSGLPYFEVAAGDGQSNVGSQVRAHVRNRTSEPVAYTFALPDIPGATINQPEGGVMVGPYGLETVEMVMILPPEVFGAAGRTDVTIQLRGSDGFTAERPYRALGPAWSGESEGG